MRLGDPYDYSVLLWTRAQPVGAYRVMCPCVWSTRSTPGSTQPATSSPADTISPMPTSTSPSRSVLFEPYSLIYADLGDRCKGPA